MEMDDVMALIKAVAFTALFLFISCVICLVVVVPIALLESCASWERARIQSEVYERQGIHMTQEEIYWGAKPALVIEKAKE